MQQKLQKVKFQSVAFTFYDTSMNFPQEGMSQLEERKRKERRTKKEKETSEIKKKVYNIIYNKLTN